MTKKDFENLSLKERAGIIASSYGEDNNFSLEQRKIIADFIYNNDLIDYLIDDYIDFDSEEPNNQSYEDSIDFIPHYNNARF